MLVRTVYGLLRGRVFGRRIPLKVQHIITFRCNYHCGYCGLWREESCELSTVEVKSLISDFRRMGAVSWTFAGGEPLVRGDIRELVEFAKSLGLMVNMTTNGRLVPENKGWLKSVDLIGVSLDGPRDVQEKTRGAGSYDAAIEAIEVLKDEGCNVLVSGVLTKSLLEGGCKRLREFLGIVDELGVKFVFLPVYIDEFNVSNDLRGLIPSPEELRSGLEVLKEYKKKHLGRVLISWPTFRWLGEYYSNPHPMKCFAGRFFCTVYPDGSIAPCMFRRGESIRLSSPRDGFHELKPIDRCVCKTNCYVEYNNMFAMRAETLLDFFYEYIT